MNRSGSHRLRKAIQDKRPAIGLYAELGPVAIELMGYCGLDYVVVDMEHTSVDLLTIEKMVATASLTGLSLLVRVRRNDYGTALTALDIGANGVVFPHVNTKQDALAAVAATKYEPIGKRGYSRPRKTIVEQTDGLTYTKQTNEDVILMPLIEEPEGVRNIDEILSVEGIDVIDTGPGDLSYSLGVPSKYQSPKLLEALEKVYDACAKKKMPFSIIFSYYPEQVRKYVNKEFSLLVDLHDDEGIFVDNLKVQLANIKSVVERPR